RTSTSRRSPWPPHRLHPRRLNHWVTSPPCLAARCAPRVPLMTGCRGVGLGRTAIVTAGPHAAICPCAAPGRRRGADGGPRSIRRTESVRSARRLLRQLLDEESGHGPDEDRP